MWPFSSKTPSGFTWYSTADEVTRGVDGSGLTAIVTGASSGIGVETTRVLATHGVHVVMAVRNLSSGDSVKEAILKENPSAKVDIMELDLASLASVKKFASEYISCKLPLNMLINNAGVMATPFMLTRDGIELQFGTNHVVYTRKNFEKHATVVLLVILASVYTQNFLRLYPCSIKILHGS